MSSLVVDFDDYCPEHDCLPLLRGLKEANPLFRCTLFAVPGLGDARFWEYVPSWCQLAVHGWLHPDPYECSEWTYERMGDAMRRKPGRFVRGWRSPGWQTSDGVYKALLDHGWWIADQHLEDHRRPEGLRTYFHEDSPDRWHGHCHDVCGNGIEETWDELLERVTAATHFRFVSERVAPWRPTVAA